MWFYDIHHFNLTNLFSIIPVRLAPIITKLLASCRYVAWKAIKYPLPKEKGLSDGSWKNPKIALCDFPFNSEENVFLPEITLQRLIELSLFCRLKIRIYAKGH